MFITIDIKRVIKITAVSLLAVLLLLGIKAVSDHGFMAAMNNSDKHTLVLDAGHGGVDGGAVAVSGEKESDINLSLALKAEIIADFLGVETALTRTEDTDGAENGEYSERENLINRVDTVNSVQNAVLISIHQNKFPSSIVSGAEVMYSDNIQSKQLGLITQDNLVSELDKENRRVARKAPTELLLTSSVSCPAILVECGFMSNPDEAIKLSNEQYQTKIATVLIASYIQYINQLSSI